MHCCHVILCITMKNKHVDTIKSCSTEGCHLLVVNYLEIILGGGAWEGYVLGRGGTLVE